MVMLRINTLLHILFLFALRSSYVNSNIRRQVVEDNVRGSSFGLESFAFQPFDNEAKPDNKIISKRVRPVAKPTPISNDRGQAYSLENFSIGGTYDANNLQRFSILPNAEFHSRRIPSATKQSVKVPVINESPPWIPTDPRTPLPTVETITERTKKRVMLRKRRKRPSNSTQTERGNDFIEKRGSEFIENRVASNFIENRVPSTSRIPVTHSVPKVAVRNKIPTEERIHSKKPFETPFQPDNKKESTMEIQRTTEQPNIRRTRTTTQLPAMNLKTFLKQQTETLSLSELLQTRNLSLADLIKGNRDASEILKGQQTTTAAPNPSVRRKVYHKVESTTESVGRSTEHVKKETVAEVSAFRPNYNRHHQKPAQIKPDVQFSSTQDYQHRDKNDSEAVSTTRKTTFDFRSRANELKLKLRNFQRRTQTASLPVEVTSPMPAKETIISLLPFSSTMVINSTESTSKNEILPKVTNDSEPLLPSTETVQELRNDRPEKASNLLKAPPSLKKFGKEKIKPNENLLKKPLKIPILESENSKENFEETVSEGNKTPTPPETETETSNDLNTTYEETEKPERKDEEKDDLLELLKSEQNANKLQKILRSRNMTLQEILENRARPTVQSDVAELFANHQKDVTYSTQPIQVFNEDGLLDFMEINKDISKDLAATPTEFEEPFADESGTATAKIQPPTYRESKQFGNFLSDEKEEIRLNLQPNDLNREKSNMEISAVWNLSESPSPQEPSFTIKNTMPVEEVTQSSNEQLPVSEIKFYEGNFKKISLNRKFKQDARNQNFEEEPVAEDIDKAYIPPAVKSAIVASGVVMGIALFVFIVLFVACGWKQRQISLKSSAASILGSTLTKKENKSKSGSAFSPDSFKEDKKFKKALEFDDDSSDSESSTTGSYLWNTLKNTFANRTNTLKNRLEKENKMREDKMSLGRFDSRRTTDKGHDRSANTFHIQKDRFQTKKIDRARNVISTSFNFRRSMSPSDLDDFSECPHGF